jgi:hypothetical protein
MVIKEETKRKCEIIKKKAIKIKKIYIILRN